MATKRKHRRCLWEAWPTSSCYASASVHPVLLLSTMFWRVWPCPAACNCSQDEGSNKYLAVCAGGRAAFHETVRKLQKDVTNFTFVFQNLKDTEHLALHVHDLGNLTNLATIITTSTLQGPFRYSLYKLIWTREHRFNAPSVNLKTRLKVV